MFIKKELLLKLANLAIMLFVLPSQGETIFKYGAATNGIRLRVDITSYDLGGGRQTPLCIVNVQNVGTNRAYLRTPTANSRFVLKLRGPDRYLIDLKSSRSISDFSGAKRLILDSNEISQVDSFSVPDAFKVKTNGTHELTISLRVSTNGLYAKNPSYFLLPSVTHSFDVPFVKANK